MVDLIGGHILLQAINDLNIASSLSTSTACDSTTRLDILVLDKVLIHTDFQIGWQIEVLAVTELGFGGMFLLFRWEWLWLLWNLVRIKHFDYLQIKQINTKKIN